MRIFAFLFGCPVVFLFFAIPSPAQDKIQLFGGYSFVHAPATFTETVGMCPVTGCVPVTTRTHLNLNGWESSGTYKAWGPVGLTAEFAGASGSFHGVRTHLYTYLFGPEASLPGPISLFAHVLVGSAHESIGVGTVGAAAVSGPTQNAFAAVVGGH